ncbi:MAG: hypothetical protein M3Q64_01480, partial [bacterium]|nr:hypothetical protein [bacterium]
SRTSPRFMLGIILGLIILAAIGFILYQQQHVKKLNAEIDQLKKEQTQKAQAEDTKELVSKIGQLISLPQDEEPTVATVTDLGPLKDQLFFANAQIGDRVLIYRQAKKAIIYRPSENKIIEVGPVNLDNEEIKNTTKPKTSTNSNSNTNTNEE